MKKYNKGILNFNVHNSNNIIHEKSLYKNNIENNLRLSIEKNLKNKEINDNRIINKELSKSIDKDLDKKMSEAKDFLNIHKTHNKKAEKLNNYSLEYRKKYELRNNIKNILRKENTYEGFKIDDIFEDL